MISIIRAGSGSGMATGSRTVDALNNEFSEAPPISIIRRMIIIKKIDPEEFEDGVNDMAQDEEFDLSPEELDDLEADVPAEADQMSDDDLGEIEDDINDLEGEESGDGNMTEEELAALEDEIPPEADALKDEDLEDDPDLDDEASAETSDESDEEEDDDSGKSKKKKESEEDEDETDELDESVIAKETINDYL